MQELKRDYTIIIVTHNMQQAARASDLSGFMYLGTHRNRPHGRDLHPAQGLPDRGLHHGKIRVRQ